VRRSFPNMLLTAGLLTALLSSGLFAGDEPPKPKDPPRGEAPKLHLHQPVGQHQAAPLERRLQALEQKLDLLLKEVHQLRREAHGRPDAPAKPAAKGRKPKPPHAKPPIEGFHGPFGPGKPPVEGRRGPDGPGGPGGRPPFAGRSWDEVPG
jgi:hypothetical protein